MVDSRVTYIKRCGFCRNDETYIARDYNVNTGISDDDMVRIAMHYVGDTEPGYCENCKNFTLHTRVAYDLSTIQEKDNE